MNRNKSLIVGSIFSLILWFFLVGSAFAGGVTDNNNNNAGDILVGTGVNNGANSIGTWTDPSFLKGEKGDKGDTGEKGSTGEKGDKGDKGDDGYTPVKGEDYFDGADGVDGQNGTNGADGLDGVNGKDGKDVDPSVVEAFKNHINSNTDRLNDLDSRVGDLEKTQYYFEGSVRLIDTRKWTVKAPVVSYNFTRNVVDRAGAEAEYKLGESYEEKLINDMKEQMDRIEAIVAGFEADNLSYAEQHYKIETLGDRTVITEK